MICYSEVLHLTGATTSPATRREVSPHRSFQPGPIGEVLFAAETPMWRGRQPNC